jgi:ubiquinone biosynthesis protein
MNGTDAGVGRWTRGRLRLLRLGALCWTLGRYGLGPLFRRLLHLGPSGPSVPVRVRLAFESLGLTYLKLGQYLAMRFDILPPDICRELGHLFEGVPPMAPEAVAQVIKSGLGAPADQLFASFEAEPLAAASVAQVHIAYTKDGQKVAVKVQRVGIRGVLVADTSNLRLVTRLVDAFHLLGRLSATEMLDQFTNWTMNELDFMIEGRTAEDVARDAVEFEKIPAVHWDLTSSTVLTLEFIDGISLATIVAEVDASGPEAVAELRPDIDLDLVLHQVTFASLNQIFVRGLFHGDAHPGNVLVQPGRGIAMVDFGIFGSLTPFDREILAGQIENLAVGRIDESLRYYRAQLSVTDQSDTEAFRREARAVLQTWYDVSLRAGATVPERHIGKYTGQMIDISRRYGLRYDMSYLLYWRALNAMDSTSLRLSKTFDLIAELRQFFSEIRPSPAQRLLDALTDPGTIGLLADLLDRDLPRAEEVLTAASDGGLRQRYQVGPAADTDRHIDRVLALITGSLFAVSLVILGARLHHPLVARDGALWAGVLLMVVSALRAVRPAKA